MRISHKISIALGILIQGDIPLNSFRFCQIISENAPRPQVKARIWKYPHTAMSYTTIFDDYLNTGVKNDAEILNYFTISRNKNYSCIYLSQSYYGTDKTIRLNCIFEFPSSNEQNMISRELHRNHMISFMMISPKTCC